MKWYILLAHPNPDSFNHAVCNAFVQGLQTVGSEVKINDLYASGFNPLMRGSDFNQFIQGARLPDDVLAEQATVDWADGLALIYPVWWNEAPAILKGWIDRVLTKGWAYDISPEGKFLALLKLQHVVIFNTADNPETLLEEQGLNQAARLTKSLGTFGFCGVQSVTHHILGNVSSDETGRLNFLEKAMQTGCKR
jgi:NAD(P)H dehydrogenase (quinone)